MCRALLHAQADWCFASLRLFRALFGWWTWQAYKATGAATEKACMLASTVSSMILKTIATTEGFLVR